MTATATVSATKSAFVLLASFASFASAAACGGARGVTVQAPVELAIAPVGKVADGGMANVVPAASGRCSVRLVASSIEKSSPGCYLDEHISEGPGLLHYPCGGNGPVEADFGEHHYTGHVAGGEVELELATELDWQDGCRWGTKATISGRLVSNGEPVSRILSWRYRDHVITGDSCSGVCTARASIQVTSMNGRASDMPAVNDEDDADSD
jgi:hypothetical protein